MSEDFDYRNGTRLDGRGFVVLGAGGGGIGTETSLALSALGAELLCVDQSPEQAEAAAEGSGGHAHAADITRREDVEAVFARAVDLFGDRFSGVVDVVGVARNGPIPSFDDAGLTRQFDLVLRHAVLALQIGAPLLAARGGGAMTFIGSISGQRAVPGQAIYGAAKAALHHLVRYAAQEYGVSGVRINAVSPGFVRTPRLVSALSEQTWDRIAADNPLRRPASPSDVARAVLFLSSDLASYVTGVVLNLDGGAGNNLVLPGLDTPLAGFKAEGAGR